MQEGRELETKIRVGWVMVALCAICFAVALFNFFPDRVGVIVSLTDPSSFMPLLAPEFQEHMPWLNLWWGLAFSLCVVHLVLGRWTTTTRWADWGLSALGVYILVRLIAGGAIALNPWVDAAVKLGLGVALVVTVIHLLARLGQLLDNRSPVGEMKQA